MSNCLIILTRNPELGKVKTRLAKGLGNENALAIYKSLLAHTRDVVTKVDCTRRVGYSVKIRTNDYWDGTHFEKFQQEGEDLGIRMQNAFNDAFDQGHSKVLIIGSDLYDLRPKHITEAFDALDQKDVVIGPAQDGGYYLLGLKKMQSEIFYNKDWGTDTVYQKTIDNLKTQTVYTLETLNDIDYAEDLKPYKEFEHYFK